MYSTRESLFDCNLSMVDGLLPHNQLGLLEFSATVLKLHIGIKAAITVNCRCIDGLQLQTYALRWQLHSSRLHVPSRKSQSPMIAAQKTTARPDTCMRMIASAEFVTMTNIMLLIKSRQASQV